MIDKPSEHGGQGKRTGIRKKRELNHRHCLGEKGKTSCSTQIQARIQPMRGRLETKKKRTISSETDTTGSVRAQTKGSQKKKTDQDGPEAEANRTGEHMPVIGEKTPQGQHKEEGSGSLNIGMVQSWLTDQRIGEGDLVDGERKRG